MARITISRLIETSRFLATKAGQELSEFITYMSDVSEQTIRAFRNSLTFEENFRCFVKVATITTNVPYSIDVDGKAVSGVFVVKLSSGATGYSSFSWTIDTKGMLQITLTLVGGTSADVRIIVLL